MGTIHRPTCIVAAWQHHAVASFPLRCETFPRCVRRCSLACGASFPGMWDPAIISMALAIAVHLVVVVRRVVVPAIAQQSPGTAAIVRGIVVVRHGRS